MQDLKIVIPLFYTYYTAEIFYFSNVMAVKTQFGRKIHKPWEPIQAIKQGLNIFVFMSSTLYLLNKKWVK